ncbi:MAG: NAD/NADP octopine/nopaline dehydrogenase family protein [Bacillota bacterium]
MSNSSAGTRFTVIGAGGGGQAMAGYLSLQGFQTNLYNRSFERIEDLAREGGVFIEGEIEGFAPLNMVTDDIAAALDAAEVVMVAVPASAHRAVAAKCAPHLRSDHIVVLNPGRTGGALEFRFVLDGFGTTEDVLVAEAQTFIFASRVVGPARARIFGIKRVVPVAALPARRTAEVLDALEVAFPQFSGAESVLQTSLDNIGAIFHPAPTILNAARIESGSPFEYYIEGVSPSVGRVLEEMDTERREVARALGVKPQSAVDFLRAAYGVESNSLYHAMRTNPGYAGIVAPGSLQHRYISEDVPASLVPMASFGDLLGVPTPSIKSMIHLACIIHGVDYWSRGRTINRLGLSGLSAEEINRLVIEGERGRLIG